MNMKKLMAVVLAVVLAISAMAVTAFAGEAETYTIDLFTDRANTNERKVTYTFDVPVYAMFGYADQAHYLEITTVNAFCDASYAVGINWAIEVNGQRFNLKGASNPADAEKNVQYVDFSFFGHDYYSDGFWAAIPQSTAVNQYTSVKLIADVTIKNVGYDPTWATWQFGQWQAGEQAVKIQLCKADENNHKTYDNTQYVEGSAILSRSMSVNKTDSSVNFSYNKFTVINDPNNTEDNYVLTWDHTLMNKSRIMNAVSAKLVVELASDNSWEGAGSTTGSALYSLWMGDAQVTPEMFGDTSLWWDTNQYARSKGFVATCTVNGTVPTLEFDVPVDMLYNGTYGYGAASVFNGGFKIYKQFEADKSAFNNGQLNGAGVVYRTKAMKAYLVLTMPVEDTSDNVEVKDPVESNTPDEETEEPGDVNVNEQPEEPEDTNPPTGIVLAVLPMVIAAAAVVASKRR